WARPLLSGIGLPARLLQPLVQPGTILGTVRPAVSAAASGTPVVAPACHDTASAVAAVATGGATAFISSGTWSLVGTQVEAPILTAKARDLNFTNEGGAAGTIRLLKNVCGLWLLQSCMRAWAAAGQRWEYAQLFEAAADDSLAFRSLLDPDCPAFLN